MTQRKLIENEIEKLKQARSSINDVLVPTYDDQGQYWAGVLFSLDDKIKHGTTDGKPYIEPEPPIPEGYRKANADDWPRMDVKYWDVCRKDWQPRLSQGTAFDPPKCNTRYIVPIDPPLTDEDARTRPWVMVRDYDDKPWQGPAKLLAATEGLPMPFIARCGGFVVWAQARRATPEEIEAAK